MDGKSNQWQIQNKKGIEYCAWEEMLWKEVHWISATELFDSGWPYQGNSKQIS